MGKMIIPDPEDFISLGDELAIEPGETSHAHMFRVYGLAQAAKTIRLYKGGRPAELFEESDH